MIPYVTKVLLAALWVSNRGALFCEPCLAAELLRRATP